MITYLIIMVIVTNGVRILPVLLLRKPIHNIFIRSFLYYVPYVTLAVMTFPAMIQATENPLAGLSAFIIGIIAAWCGLGMFPVSIITCLIVMLVHWLA